MWFNLGGMDLTSCVFITRICAAQLGKIPIWKTTNKHVMWNPKNSFYIKTWKKINKKDWLTLHSAALMFTFVICDNRGKRAARARGGNSIRWRELFNKQKHPCNTYASVGQSWDFLTIFCIKLVFSAQHNINYRSCVSAQHQSFLSIISATKPLPVSAHCQHYFFQCLSVMRHPLTPLFLLLDFRLKKDGQLCV